MSSLLEQFSPQLQPHIEGECYALGPVGVEHMFKFHQAHMEKYRGRKTTPLDQLAVELATTMCGKEGPCWNADGNGPTVEQLENYWQGKGVILPTPEQYESKT